MSSTLVSLGSLFIMIFNLLLLVSGLLFIWDGDDPAFYSCFGDELMIIKYVLSISINNVINCLKSYY